jgi:hypothetical protein
MLKVLKHLTTALPQRDTRRVGITLLSLAGALIVLALVGLLMAVPFLVRRDIPSGEIVELGDLRAASKVVIQTDGGYLLTLQFTDNRGFAVDPETLRVALTMDGHSMEPETVPLQRTTEGEYRAKGQFTMNGRWRFGVTSERGAMDVVANYARSFSDP